MSGRILIVDDVAANRIVFQARMTEARYEPVLASDGASCLAMAQGAAGDRPDLILLGLDLPDLPGPVVLRKLRADPRSRDIPVIGLIAVEDCPTRHAAFAAGADDVIAKSAPDRLLLARVRNLLRARIEQSGDAGIPAAALAEASVPFETEGTIAVVTAGPDRAADLRRDIAGQVRDRLIALDEAGALDEATAGIADVFLIDLNERDPAGMLRILSELKSRFATRHAAVCITGPAVTLEVAAMAFDLGADDVAGPGVPGAELALRLRALLRRKHSRDRQRSRVADGLRLALIDPLTGLFNRRHAIPELRAIAMRAEALGQAYSVLVVDLDRFKLVNDLHGHAAGDAVLVEVARRLRSNLRDGDLLARIGGEEFLIALPITPAEEARLIAVRLCQAIEATPIRSGPELTLAITASIGVASSLPGRTGASMIDSVVEAADQGLRAAKRAGRNQVTLCRSAA